MKKHILFDLDGTLTDSSPGIVNSIKHALDQMGIAENDEQKLRSFVGPPLKDTFGNNYFVEQDDLDKAVKHYRTYFANKGIFENALYDGIKELLQHLQDGNYTLSLATAKPTYFANIILKHFKIDHHFEVVVGSHLSGKRTNKIEIIHEVLDQLGLPSSEQCIMIGDREYDINGAKHHQLKTIGVHYGYAVEKELENAKADKYAREVAELAEIIKYI